MFGIFKDFYSVDSGSMQVVPHYCDLFSERNVQDVGMWLLIGVEHPECMEFPLWATHGSLSSRCIACFWKTMRGRGAAQA
jgi:hypothetical protein